MDQSNKKYPKSINNRQCLGPCYKKNTKIIHPLYLSVVSYNKSFCPVAEYIVKENNKKYYAHTDECIENQEFLNTSNFNYEYNLLNPDLGFLSQNFISIYYNINNFSEGIEWISQNSNLPLDNRERIFNLIFDAFHESIDIIELSDNRFNDFLIILIKSKYNDKLSRIFKYIKIDNKFVSIRKHYESVDETETSESIVLKTNFIFKNLITYEQLSNFISKNIRTKFNVSIMMSYSEILIDKLIIYLIDDIKKIIISK
jgi:hypothetical protein